MAGIGAFCRLMGDVQTAVTRRKLRKRPPVRLSGAAARTVARFLAERGVSENDIDRGLHYAELNGARTIRDGFVLAMSRVTLSDEQLVAGVRFSCGE